MKVSKIQSPFRSKNGVVKFNSNKFSTFIKWAFLPKSIFVQNCFSSRKQINSIRLKNFPIFKISYTKLLSIFLILIKFRNFVHLLTISPPQLPLKCIKMCFSRWCTGVTKIYIIHHIIHLPWFSYSTFLLFFFVSKSDILSTISIEAIIRTQ